MTTAAAAEPVSRLVAVITEPLPVTGFVARLETLETEHGPGLRVHNAAGALEIRTPGRVCGCLTCSDADAAVLEAATGRLVPRLFVVCPDCGHKRCPRATHHDQTCSGSNEPGQPGSAYEAHPGTPGDPT